MLWCLCSLSGYHFYLVSIDSNTNMYILEQRRKRRQVMKASRIGGNKSDLVIHDPPARIQDILHSPSSQAISMTPTTTNPDHHNSHINTSIQTAASQTPTTMSTTNSQSTILNNVNHLSSDDFYDESNDDTSDFKKWINNMKVFFIQPIPASQFDLRLPPHSFDDHSV